MELIIDFILSPIGFWVSLGVSSIIAIGLFHFFFTDLMLCEEHINFMLEEKKKNCA